MNRRIIPDIETAKRFQTKYGHAPKGWEKEFEAPGRPPQGTELERAALRVGGQKFVEPSRAELPYPGTISAKVDTLALQKAGILPGGLPEERKMDLTGVINRLQAGTATRADSLKAEKDLPGIFSKPYGPESIAKAEEVSLKKVEKKRTTAKSERTAYETALKGKNAAVTYNTKVQQGATPEEASAGIETSSDYGKLLLELIRGNKLKYTPENMARIQGSIDKLIGSYDETITGYENKRLDTDIESFNKQFPASQYDGQTATDSKTGLKLMSQNGEWVILDKIEGR